MADHKSKLESLQSALAEESLYSDPDRSEELAKLTQQRGEHQRELENLEWSWLEASEALDRAQKDKKSENLEA